jgi:hypothetical protein
VAAKRKWLVHQLADELDAGAVTHEYAAAFKDYCTTVTCLAEHVRAGQYLSLDEMDELEAAKLRLENARTLCEFYVSGGTDPAKLRDREWRTRLKARH